MDTTELFRQMLLAFDPTTVITGSPVLADIPTQFFYGIWAGTPFPHSGSVLCRCPYKERIVRQNTIARTPSHRSVDVCCLALPPRLWQPRNPEGGEATVMEGSLTFPHSCWVSQLDAVLCHTQDAKRNDRHAMHHAHQEADKNVYENIDPKFSEVYRLANQFRRETPDVIGDKPVKNDAGEMSMSEDSKQKAWLEHYQRLLNVQFDWDPDHLSYQPPVEGPPIPTAISQMKAGKAPGPSGIVVEMIWAAGDMGASMILDLAAAIIRDGKVPSDWEQFHCLPLQGKGWRIGKGQLPRSQADRAGYENPGEDCGWPQQTVSVNRRFPVWLCPRQRHCRRNLCCQAAAREVSSCQQETTWLS